MKRTHYDPKKGAMTLEPEHNEDLYHLSTIIEPGDTVTSQTIRKIKLSSGEETRKSPTITRTLHLTILTETTAFTGDTLRIHGTVQHSEEGISRQSHHTLTIEPYQRLTITKTGWPAYLLKTIEDACAGPPPRVLVAILDRDEAYLALLKTANAEIISHLHAQQEKKAHPQAHTDFYKTIAALITQQDTQHHFDAVLIASPAFFKDEVAKHLPAPIHAKLVLATSSSVGPNGIQEVLKRQEAHQLLNRIRTGKELREVESFLLEVGRSNGKAAYGLHTCLAACQAKAISVLLVTDGLIQTSRQEGTFSSLSSLMNQAESTGAHITIISSQHEGGQRLDGIGGIGAILRFAIE